MRARPGKSAQSSDASYLNGQLLIAMPGMTDKRFARSVIYMCLHSSEGAMGLIINQRAPNVTFTSLLDQLDIVKEEAQDTVPGRVLSMAVHVGGPVDAGRGFVLHSPDYSSGSSTITIDRGVCLTSTIDILKALARGRGPEHAILALGYSGWSQGQLENEIQANAWLSCPADADIIFDPNLELKYDLALSKLGIDPGFLVNDAGHA